MAIPIDGATGAEAPAYDFSKGDGALIMPPPRAAQLTTAHRGPDGAGSVVLTNMSHAPLDLAGWTLRVDAKTPIALPAAKLGPGQPTSIALPRAVSTIGAASSCSSTSRASAFTASPIRGGDPVAGWSSTFHRAEDAGARLHTASPRRPRALPRRFAGCASKIPMLGNAGLWGPSRPRAQYSRSGIITNS